MRLDSCTSGQLCSVNGARLIVLNFSLDQRHQKAVIIFRVVVMMFIGLGLGAVSE